MKNFKVGDTVFSKNDIEFTMPILEVKPTTIVVGKPWMSFEVPKSKFRWCNECKQWECPNWVIPVRLDEYYD